MIRRNLLVALICIVPMLASAQSKVLSAKEMVAITPMLPDNVKVPEDAKKSLTMKLNQMVTQNGFGSSSGQFVLTADIVVLDKQATATAPVQFIVDLEVSVYIVNVAEQVVIDETSFTVKGIDRLENKAVIQAINQIKPRSPQVRAFMDGSRTKIIEYYNTRIPSLLTTAKSLSDRGEFEEALLLLSGVPESVDQYPAVAEQMTAIFIKKIDKDANIALQNAKGAIAAREYGDAINYIASIDPSSTQYPQAQKMMQEVSNLLDERERKAFELQMKLYNDELEMTKQMMADEARIAERQIEAIEKIGVAAANSGQGVRVRLNRWYANR